MYTTGGEGMNVPAAMLGLGTNNPTNDLKISFENSDALSNFIH